MSRAAHHSSQRTKITVVSVGCEVETSETVSLPIDSMHLLRNVSTYHPFSVI
jgi:hypothetical protein